MDPLEWLARLSDHIPDPGQHRTLFYGEYSSRVRGAAASSQPEAEAGQEHEPRRRASPSWGRLIAKVYQVDPFVCTRCGKRMSVVAFVTDSAAIGRILDHLGLSSPEAEKPPPVREILRVAECADAWGVPLECECPAEPALPSPVPCLSGCAFSTASLARVVAPEDRALNGAERLAKRPAPPHRPSPRRAPAFAASAALVALAGELSAAAADRTAYRLSSITYAPLGPRPAV